MIKYGLYGLSILVLMLGCSSKETKSLMKDFNKNKIYFNTLQKTEKILLSDKNETKAVITLKYLKNKKNIDDNETFIIGLYFEDDNVTNIEDILGLKDKDDNGTENIVENNTLIVIKSFDVNNTELNTSKTLVKMQKNPYGLTLNNKKAIFIEKLQKNDVRLKYFAFKSEWASYALIRFEYVENERLHLRFNSKRYGKGKVNFSKVAKYVLTNKAFK